MPIRRESVEPFPKWPFVAADLALLATAAAIIWLMPPGGLTAMLAAGCALAGAAALAAPFLIEAERSSRQASADREEAAAQGFERMQLLTQQLTHAQARTQALEDQTIRALGSLDEISARLGEQSEELTARLERLAEGNGQSAAAAAKLEKTVGEALAALRAAADRSPSKDADPVVKLEGRLAALETALAALPATMESALQVQLARGSAAAASSERIAGLEAALLEKLGGLESQLASLQRRSSPAPSRPRKVQPAEDPDTEPMAAARANPEVEPQEPAPETSAEPESAPATAKIETETAAETGSTTVDPEPEPAAASDELSSEAPPAPEPKPEAKPRKTNGRKPEAEAAEPDLALALELPAPTRRKAPPRGATGLIATAYIGIGNKLYVRGEGAGLSWDRGQPMDFLAIGRWGWTASGESAEPITYRIYRNDEEPALDEPAVIEPGETKQVAPRFST
jgi:hypothetical protein